MNDRRFHQLTAAMDQIEAGIRDMGENIDRVFGHGNGDSLPRYQRGIAALLRTERFQKYLPRLKQ